MQMKWEPIINGADKAGYYDKLSGIASALAESKASIPSKEVGFFAGKTGIMLFLFYYSRLVQNQAYNDLAVELLIEVMEEPFINHGIHAFSMGQSGIVWVIEHLAANGFIDMDTDEALEELEPLIYKTMKMDLLARHYDYMHGAIGNGLYFLERADKPHFQKYIVELIDQLDKISIRNDDGGIKWRSDIDRIKKIKGFNTGMSHGSASIITFLARVLQAGIHKEKTSRLLEGAVKYLLQQQLEQGNTGEQYHSLFPNVALESDTPKSSRLAWCYGDLGIGIALWQAGCISDKTQWKNKAIEVLTHSAGRRDLETNHISDACLCHGTAGIAHIFNRIFHDTGDTIFKDASLYWWRKTLEMAKYEDGHAGFKSRSAFDTEEVFINNTGFLEGVAGTGLAMISAISGIEPKWDRALLLS